MKFTHLPMGAHIVLACERAKAAKVSSIQSRTRPQAALAKPHFSHAESTVTLQEASHQRPFCRSIYPWLQAFAPRYGASAQLQERAAMHLHPLHRHGIGMIRHLSRQTQSCSHAKRHGYETTARRSCGWAVEPSRNSLMGR